MGGCFAFHPPSFERSLSDVPSNTGMSEAALRYWDCFVFPAAELVALRWRGGDGSSCGPFLSPARLFQQVVHEEHVRIQPDSG